MLVLLPMLAFAGWRQIGTIAGIQDLQVVDAGVVLTVSTTGATAWQVLDGGTTQLNNLSGNLRGAGYFGANCLVGFAGTTRQITSSPGCGVTATLGVIGTGVRFRLLSSLQGVAVLTDGFSTDFMYGGPLPDAGWEPRGTSWQLANTRTLQTARVGGADYAVMNVGSPAMPAVVRVSVDGGAPFSLVVPATVRDAAPFERAGATAVMATALTGGALMLVPDLSGTAMPLTPSMGAGVVARYLGMSGLTGMATTGGGGIIGPIPDPARPGLAWKWRGAPAGVAFTDRISCLADRWCVTVEITSGNIWLYENDTPPAVAVIAPSSLAAGQTIRLVADAGDGDGDPIFVSWSSDAGTLVPVAGVDDGTAVDFTASFGVCAPTLIDVTVSDGLAPHDRTIQVPMTVADRGTPEVIVSTRQPLAGGAPVILSAFVDGGCVSAAFTWTTPDGGGGSGPTFAWTPPATECNSDGGLVTITATAAWASGTPSTTQLTQDLVVQPWGAPNPPVFASPGTQPRGLAVDWRSSGPEHACSSAASDFPGTTLSWTWSVDGGASVTEIDGGLRIFASQCVGTGDQVLATAVRHVLGDPGRVSAPASLVVDVPPDAPPLDANTGFGITAAGDAGLLFGRLQIDAGCLAERGATVGISISSAGNPVVDGGFAAEGGSWALPVVGGCSGGTYEVVAQLFERGVFTGATDQQQVTLDFSPVQVGPLSVDRVDVRCGAGASGPVRLLSVPNACGVAEVTWRATSGPALIVNAGAGDTFDLQTAALDFSLVGQQVSFEFAADAGAGNVDVATRTIELGVQPFLEVGVKARPPLRREEEGVLLEVTIVNPTDCQVEGLSLTLPFSGGAPLLETALLDGRRVPARATDEGVVIDAVAVPPRGETKLQLTARARLLSTPTVVPVASLNGYVVSTAAPVAAPATGCGCSELASPAFFALLTLVLRRRRR